MSVQNMTPTGWQKERERASSIQRASKGLDLFNLKVNDWVANIGAGAVMAIMALTIADIIGRYIFTHPVPGAHEIVVVLLPWAIWTGFAYSLVQGIYVRVSLVTNRLSPPARWACDIFADCLGALSYGMLSVSSWFIFWRSLMAKEILPSILWVPWPQSKFVCVFTMALVSLAFIGRLLQLLAAGPPPKPTSKEAN